jgi:hypothetical protein
MDWFLVFFCWATLPILLTWFVLYLLVRRFQGVTKRNPLTKNLLRSPGESLRDQIEDTTWNLTAYLSCVPLVPLFAYGAFVSQVAFAQRQATLLSAALFIVFAVTAEATFILKIYKLLQLRRRRILGYDAELAVGQELSALASEGFRVFHDLPANGFNIDHVAVGPNGVFAFETKGRPKPTRSRANDGHIVKYDGVTLHFPTWRETKPLQQAERQAKWLAEWISGAVGQTILVKPILVLPGWFIERTGPSGIPVLAGQKIGSFLTKVKAAEPLDAVLVQRIAFQLDQRCRDVTPRAYSKEPQPRK